MRRSAKLRVGSGKTVKGNGIAVPVEWLDIFPVGFEEYG